jgi:hypothetical protein
MDARHVQEVDAGSQPPVVRLSRCKLNARSIMSQLVQRSTILLLLTGAAACTSSLPPSIPTVIPGPTPTPYSGTVQDAVSGVGTLRITLSTYGSLISGTWNVTFNGRAAAMRYISGTVNNNMLAGTVHPEASDSPFFFSTGCTSSLTATFSSSTITGTYSTAAATAACPTPPSGSFSVTRQ